MATVSKAAKAAQAGMEEEAKAARAKEMEGLRGKRKAAVTVPSLSVAEMQEGDSIFVRVESEIVDKPDINQKTGEQKVDPDTGKPQFLHIVRVTNIEDGALYDLVLGIVAERALREYTGGYVGKSFELMRGKKKGRTVMWSVYEIEA